MRSQFKIKTWLILLAFTSLTTLAAEGTNGTIESQNTNNLENNATPSTENSTKDTTSTTDQTTNSRQLISSQQKRIDALRQQMTQNAPNELERLFFEKEGFLTLYREAQTHDPQGCIILLHGNNEHPNWPNVIQPIRMAMPQYSWCTLSIEIPDTKAKEALSTLSQAPNTDSSVADPLALPNEAIISGRINAAIDFARENRIENISLLGYGTGATYALKHVTQTKQNTGALVLISAKLPDTLSPFPFAKLLQETQIPVLDYYIAPNKFDKQYAQARLQAMQQRAQPAPVYRQIKMTGNNQFAMDEEQLVRRVRGFLKQNTQQKDQRKPLPVSDKALFYTTP